MPVRKASRDDAIARLDVEPSDVRRCDFNAELLREPCIRVAARHPAARLPERIECGFRALARLACGLVGERAERDARERVNAATLAGWRVLRFPGAAVRSGAAVATVIEALGRRR